MINDPNAIFVYIIFLIGIIYYLRSQPSLAKLFKYMPPVIWVYFLPMISTSIGIIPNDSDLYGWTTRHLLPPALILLLLSSNIRAMTALGPKAIGTMLFGTLGIIIGGSLSLLIFGGLLPDDAWMGLGALSGSCLLYTSPSPRD